jgi:hypothetical protein
MVIIVSMIVVLIVIIMIGVIVVGEGLAVTMVRIAY